MKKLFFLSTRLGIYWIEIPPIVLLIPTVIYNDSVKTVFKLYPLMFALSVLIVFFALYFFKAVSISFEEIRSISLFSSRDKATIKEDRALVITLLKKKRIKVELFGKNDDGEQSYAWLRNEEPSEINLFRAKINGGARQVKKILRYFKTDEDKIDEIIKNDDARFSSDEIDVSSKLKDGFREIKIHFKKTV